MEKILTPLQKKILLFLSKDKNFTQDFYFTGGTVLAEYYLFHRLSEKLDFQRALKTNKNYYSPFFFIGAFNPTNHSE